tara:strand:- start:2928 stop:4115 length:1188 start_codon:yes stop_codon:yes gene_type:complete
MDSTTLNKLTIEIPYKSSLKEAILGFGAYLGLKGDSNNFLCETIKKETLKSNEREITNLRLNYGKHEIEYNSNLILINFQKIGKPVGLSYTAECFEEMYISIKFLDKEDKLVKEDVIQKFIKDSIEYFKINSTNDVICKILKNGSWYYLSKLPKRPIDTIDLPKDDLDLITNDIESFYKNKDEYIRLGIPWKRNYLLEGLPGTGKTSLIFSLASHFSLDVYIINLGPKVDDSTFMSSISKISKNAILLLEDVDALFVDRKANDSNKSLVSFSGILNVLDGMARKNGLITFLTTNYRNRLDPALIRPSRIDYIMSFKEITIEQIKSMFIRFFPDKIDKLEKFISKTGFLQFRTSVLQQFFMEVKFNNQELFNISRLKQIIKEMENKEDLDINGLYN